MAGNAEQSAAENAPECERHPGQAAHMRCSQCSKPICRECVQTFGYFCSLQCLNTARGSVSEQDRAERAQQDEEFDAMRKRFRLVLAGVSVLIVLVSLLAVWRFVIASPGKVCWTWRHTVPLHNVRVLVQAGQTWAVTAGKLTQLDPESGEITGEWDLPDNVDVSSLVLKQLDGDLLLYDEHQVVRTSPGASPKVSIALERDAQKVICENGRAWALLPRVYGFSDDEKPSQVVCYDLTTGSELWRTDALPGHSANRLFSAAGRIFALEEPNTMEDTTSVLRALDGEDGRQLWKLTLPETPTWGPIAADNQILFQAETILYAVSTQGKESWRLTVADALAPAHFVDDGQLFLQAENGTECHNLRTGKKIWSCPYNLNGYLLMRLKDGDLIASAYPPADDDKLPELAGSEGGEQVSDILKEMGAGKDQMQTLMQRPVLVRLKGKTGEPKWQSRKVLGELLSDGRRIVHVLDSSNTSLLEMVSGGKGITVIEQYDIKDGSRMYNRHLDIGLVPSGISGRRLLGVSYTRTDRPGLSDFGSKKACENFLKSPDSEGVVGIRLR